MDPNDIYSLAQQAGVVDPATPSYADAAGQQGFTDEDILAHFVPPQAQDDTQSPSLFQSGPQLTPPSPPGLSSLQSPAAPLTPGSKQSGSVTQNGYSDTKNNQIRKGPGARLDNQIADINAQGDQKVTAESQSYNAAATEEKDAAHQEALATADYATAAGHQKAILAQLQTAYDTRTGEIVDQEQGAAQVAKAKYVAALNDFRAARVDPAQLWNNIGTGGQLGMLAAAFVQDFLGVKGINTSAMGTFNKAIDRSIDAQVRAIQTKGQVAEGFKNLWDMQMAESNSVEEARTRMRGFMLDSAKTAVEAHMAQFDSALASAKGQVAVAKIDQELAKNIAEVSKHVDGVTATRINQAISRYGDELRASTEYARISAEKQMAADRLKAEHPQGPNIASLIPDNTDSGQGMARWEFNNPNNKELNNKYLEKQGEVDNTLKLIRQYRELQRKHGQNQGLASGTRWGSAEDQQLKALATEILGNRLLEKSGKAATDNERKALEIGTPQALFSGNLDVEKVLGLTENIERQSLDSLRDTVAHEIPKDDPRRSLKLGRGGAYGEAEGKEASAVASGAADEKTSEQKMRDSDVKDFTGPTSKDTIEGDIPDDVKAEHAAFLKRHPDVNYTGAVKVEPPGGKAFNDEASYADEYAKKGYKVTPIDSGPKQFERGLTRLKVEAEKAKATMADPNADETARNHASLVYRENVKTLRHVATAVASGTNPDDVEGNFALDLIGELGEDTSRTLDEHPGNEGHSEHDLDPRIVLPPLPQGK